ncbi:MAG TPA: M20/M25/M40 family metallo-hydrolase [Myxococcota bacterium]|nr:M20/M25/M40 family metallo-hydrolase [Myxococcota bacterium]
MTLDHLLDAIVVPRPNGSEALAQVARFLETTLRASGAQVGAEAFAATPWGFRLAFGVALLLVLGAVAAVAARRFGPALALALAAPVLLFAEFELLFSPVSGLLERPQVNVVGEFPGAADGPTLILSAHYDSTTHFGDHFTWHAWGLALGPASAALVGLSAAGLVMRRRGRALPRVPSVALALAATVPYAAMAWFDAAGPLLREPSPGALDDGGSVAALLLLAPALAERGTAPPVTVRLVFFSAEEERALGSWAYAQAHAAACGTAVVNLEGIGAEGELGLVTEDGFELRRFASPPWLAVLVDDAARDATGAPVARAALPRGSHTDGRSFLAHGVPAVSLVGSEGGGFPHGLHSFRDARARLSTPAIEKAVAVLRALVSRLDRAPGRIPRCP